MLTDRILSLTWRAFLQFFRIHAAHFLHPFLLNIQDSTEQDLQCEADGDAADQNILIILWTLKVYLQCAALNHILSQLNPCRILFIKK
jgi:hypothetical protein